MRRKRNQFIWSWATLALLLGPVLFSACNMLGINGGDIAASNGTQIPAPTLVATLDIVLTTPTARNTLASNPTATHTAALSPSATVPAPTSTPLPTATATPVTPTPTTAPKPFAVQLGSPSYIRAFTHSDQGCNWLGVAGQVFDPSGAGADGLAVLITGSVDGQALEQAVMTGSTSPYGPGGYEIPLFNHMLTGKQVVTVQLYTLKSEPLSEPQIITLPDQCDQNLILVNFQSSYTTQRIFLPILNRSE